MRLARLIAIAWHRWHISNNAADITERMRLGTACGQSIIGTAIARRERESRVAQLLAKL
jgi:hypothetical protein